MTADAAHNRRKKLSKERRSDTPRDVVETESGNVYSELNSSFQYSSSEFDSVYSIDNPGFTKSSAVDIMETIRDDEDADDVSDGYDSEFDDNPEVTGISYNMYITNKSIKKLYIMSNIINKEKTLRTCRYVYNNNFTALLTLNNRI